MRSSHEWDGNTACHVIASMGMPRNILLRNILMPRKIIAQYVIILLHNILMPRKIIAQYVIILLHNILMPRNIIAVIGTVFHIILPWK